MFRLIPFLAAACLLLGPLRADESVWLDTLGVEQVRQDWGRAHANRSAQGNPIAIGGRRFERGVGTHANSRWEIDLEGEGRRFSAWVGADDELPGHPGSVQFRVLGDAKLLWQSAVKRIGDAPDRVEVDVSGVQTLTLVVTDAGDGIDSDHADWADALVVRREQRPEPVGSARYLVHGGALTVGVSPEGEIVRASFTRGTRADRRLLAQTRLAGCVTEGAVSGRPLPGGGVEFTKRLRHRRTGRTALLTERLRPTASSVRWEIAVQSDGAPWSTSIRTELKWPEPPFVPRVGQATSPVSPQSRTAPKARFWTAWADARAGDQSGWRDPLEPQPLSDRRLSYGALPYQSADPRLGYCPFEPDIFCLPLATILEPEHDLGLSLVLSPADTLLEMTLVTDARGGVAVSRENYRLGERRIVRFAMDLVPHEGDWRPGLGWMVERYPEYFDPPNPRADALAGTGAYSNYEGPLDTAKLKRMAFRVNWCASFDFPYMGMFLPPVGDDEKWRRFGGGETSIRQMDDYCRRMRELGFFVLSYFNVTEFGAHIAYPPPASIVPAGPQARKAVTDADLWRDPNDFLWGRLSPAVLRGPDGRPLWTWEGGIAMDPGERVYQDFLIAQARRHIEKLPDAPGICIDRTDWLRVYRTERDDGVSFFEGRPARSLLLSWRDCLNRLGPLMHGAGKVIFCNKHIKRLEVLRQVDGIFDEFTYHPFSLNPCALLGIRKPVIGWVGGEDNLKPDPDAFFQRNLHLGVYPMAPFPGNDHSIQPSPWAEKWYLDYGPLLDAMRGKKWVLKPHVIEVEGGRAKANLFRVPAGWVIPVTFGGEAQTVTVIVRDPEVLHGMVKCEALHPGSEDWAAVGAERRGEVIRLRVPLVRGCAMVRTEKAARVGQVRSRG